jgi:hypothetical protein
LKIKTKSFGDAKGKYLILLLLLTIQKVYDTNWIFGEFGFHDDPMLIYMNDINVRIPNPCPVGTESDQ